MDHQHRPNAVKSSSNGVRIAQISYDLPGGPEAPPVRETDNLDANGGQPSKPRAQQPRGTGEQHRPRTHEPTLS